MADALAISQHMESHYRKIATAKGRIDTSMPTAMKLGMKTRDRHRKKKRLVQTNHGNRGIQEVTTDALDPVLDFPPGVNNRSTTPRSDLYFTQTGRVSAQSPSPKKLVSNSPPAWIPVMNHYTSHSISSDKNTYKNRSVVVTKQHTNNIPLSNHHISKGQTSQVKEPSNDVSQFEESTDFEDSTLMADGKNSIQNSTFAQEGISSHLKDTNEFVTQRMLREALAEGNARIKQRIEQSHQEQVYLQFLSTITTDILTRGVYGDSSLDALFESHVTRNKHKLNEHLMIRKIEWLKRKLNMT